MTVLLDGSASSARCGPFTAGNHVLTGVPTAGSGLPAPQLLPLEVRTPSQAGGHAYSWGSNPIGFGDDSTTSRAVPTQIGTGSWWWHVAAGSGHVLASRTDATIWTWGDDSHHQLGTGPEARDNLVPTWLPASAGQVTAFGRRSYIDSGGPWGSPAGFGEDPFGDGNQAPAGDVPTPSGVSSNGTTLSLDPLSAGGSVTAGIMVGDGGLWIWGSNTYGELGNGTATARPDALRLGTDSWLDVAAGENHVVAVRSDGTLWQWGLLVRGDGNGAGRVIARTPQQVGTATDWKTVSAGSDVSAAVNSTGQLWVWGDNSDAQLGDGTETSRPTPVRVGATQAWTKVVFGGTHTAAIATDGSLWTWGHDGSDAASVHLAPTRVGTQSTWTDVAAGTGFTVALRP